MGVVTDDLKTIRYRIVNTQDLWVEVKVFYYKDNKEYRLWVKEVQIGNGWIKYPPLSHPGLTITLERVGRRSKKKDEYWINYLDDHHMEYIKQAYPNVVISGGAWIL